MLLKYLPLCYTLAMNFRNYIQSWGLSSNIFYYTPNLKQIRSWTIITSALFTFAPCTRCFWYVTQKGRVYWQVVFSDAWWIGTKEENPDELRLEMPLDFQQVCWHINPDVSFQKSFLFGGTVQCKLLIKPNGENASHLKLAKNYGSQYLRNS